MARPTLRHRGVSRPRSADIMIDEITDLVVKGEYGLGDRIGSELDLIRRFGLSRGSVREALRILEREGIVSVKPGTTGGIFCAYPGIRPLARSIDLYGAFHDVTPDDLVEARMELEVLTTRLAAVRATADDLIELERWNGEWIRLVGVGQTEAAARVNVGFHVSLARAAHNPVFVAFIDALEGLLYETALEPTYPDRKLDYVVYSHEYILESVRQHDPEAASARMRRHLETFRPNAWKKAQADRLAAPGGDPEAEGGSNAKQE
jgi:GntR family transcriptional repressor for pyruvate dehydrogenase complex